MEEHERREKKEWREERSLGALKTTLAEARHTRPGRLLFVLSVWLSAIPSSESRLVFLEAHSPPFLSSPCFATFQLPGHQG